MTDREAPPQDNVELALTLLQQAAPWLTVAGAVAVGYFLGLPVAVLVLAGGALVLAIVLLWSSLNALTESGEVMTLEEALDYAAPSAEEERKQAVLRALKDLDYERKLGKLSDADYSELSARYRGEAKHLLQIVDREMEGKFSEFDELVRARLGEAPAPTSSAGSDDAREQPETAEKPVETEVTASEIEAAMKQVVCRSCSTVNDADATFCKRCGTRLAPENEDNA